jgi:hypothetical protein
VGTIDIQEEQLVESEAREFVLNALIEAKAAEAKARAYRIEMEEKLVSLLDKEVKELGTTTVKIGILSVKVKKDLLITANVEEMRRHQFDFELPLKLRPAAYEFNASMYKKLGEREVRELSQFVQTKPAKTSVEIAVG